MTRTAVLLPALSLLALAGCARDGGTFPSLAPRPTEKLGFAEPEAPPAPPLTADPTLDARIAALTTQLGAAARGFDAALGKARAAAGRPGARTAGSDAWLDAQTALSGLDDWRGQASGVAAEASGLAATRAQTLAPDYPALARIQAAAEAETTRQDSAIGKLQASLPGT
jgi:hypothetical protein